MTEKKTKGKQKIEIKKIERDEDRMITFSKRRSGIYKKANELVALCDVEVAFLVYSNSGNPFTFAHPSMEVVTDRYKNRNTLRLPLDNTTLLTKAYRKQRVDELAKEYERLVEEAEAEKEKEKATENVPKAKMAKNCWWKTPIDEIDDEDTRRSMHDAFVELHDNLCEVLEQRLHVSPNNDGSSSSSAPPPLYA